MQQYINDRCNEIDIKYSQQENALRNAKALDCRALSDEQKKKKEANVKKRKVFTIIAEAVALFISVPLAAAINSGISAFIVIVACVIAYIIVKTLFHNIEKQLDTDTQNRIYAREQQFSNDIQQLNAKKSVEKKQLETTINNLMNQYRKTFEQKQTTTYLVEWLLSVMSIEIKKADRSKWLPQVKTSLRFNVAYNNIEIPGFGKYDMVSQGINIDNNPMAVGALAYVLEKKTLGEAQKRFQFDPNGGIAVFSSTRNDSHVEIIYSAPNGQAQVAR